MNGAYLHLAVNHVPVLAAPFAALLLLGALIRKSRDLAQAGYVALILMAIACYLSLRTGGPAAGMVHSLPGIEHGSIHEHAKAADFTFWPSIVLAALSLFGLWKSAQSGEAPMAVTVIALLGALFLSTVFARVAHLGGLIRHPEISNTFVAPAQ